MSQANEAERFMLDLINAERAAAGLDAVVLDTRLNASSEDHSSWMLNTSTFAHQGVGGSSAGDRMDAADFDFSGSYGWGENIAWQSERGDPGIQDDVAALHQGLMNSPGHRANILNPEFEALGIGIEVGNFDGFEAVMVTQNFAYTDGDLQPDTGTTPPAPQPPVDQTPEPETPADPAPVPDPDPTPTPDPVPTPTPDPEPPVAENPTPPAPETPTNGMDDPFDQAGCPAYFDWEVQRVAFTPQLTFSEADAEIEPFLDAIQSMLDYAGWDFWGAW